MFWNNCPGLLCYMLAFYPNVHLISIRMFTWTEVRLVVISYTATPLKATAAQHLNTTQIFPRHWAKLWGRYHETAATSRWISFILSGLSATTKTRGRREFQFEEEMKPGDRDRRKPPTGCPALLTAPAGRASPPPQPADPAPSSHLRDPFSHHHFLPLLLSAQRNFISHLSKPRPKVPWQKLQ